MLGIKEGVRIWYVSGITNMRYGKYRLFSEVEAAGANPYNGDAYCFMSKSHQMVKIIRYASHKRYLYDVTFDSGYKFMKVLTEDGKTLCECDYKHIEVLLQCPVVSHMKI